MIRVSLVYSQTPDHVLHCKEGDRISHHHIPWRIALFIHHSLSLEESASNATLEMVVCGKWLITIDTN